MPLMKPPAKGVRVRMYRQGHGDCFLLAMKKKDDKSFYMLIDCGLWRGSQLQASISEVVKSIEESTAGKLDVVLITHEHEDHVNGFGAGRDDGSDCWSEFDIGEVWLAWTEDGTDEDANALRKRFDDTLLGLAAAVASPLALAAVDDPRLQMIRDMIALHTGVEDVDQFSSDTNAMVERSLAANEPLAAKIKGIKNKTLMKKMRDAAKKVRFLDPKKGPYTPASLKGVRIFALGPPRKEALLTSLNPQGDEGFKFHLDRAALGLFRALSPDQEETMASRPFSPRYGTPISKLRDERNEASEFFETHHGYQGESEGGPEWRRIDNDWLDAAEALAMRLGDEVNNTSLVIAIELEGSGKVLLFPGDAQRGNWISWSNLTWDVDGHAVTARELLGRTVLYKVGHHGSHNATLKGTTDDAYANLGWLGLGEYADEFTAMIPANKKWAYGKARPWPHPLKSIEKALMEKAQGKVFRTDEAKGPRCPAGVSAREWKAFTDKSVTDKLYFEYVVSD